MTIVAAVKDKKGIYMGADSLGSNRYTGTAYKNNKVMKKDNFLIGCCGSYRLMCLIAYKFTIPAMKVDQNVEDYIHVDFCDALVKLFRDNFILKKVDFVEEIDNSEFIFAFKNRLFKFQPDLSILEPKSDFVSCGSGEYHADASLFSTANTELGGEERIKRAIICANNFVLSVNDDITIEFMGKSK